jgi:hypothetical protein
MRQIEMMWRFCICGLLLAVSGGMNLLSAQVFEPDPTPIFRWFLPVPEVAGKNVKMAVVADHQMWKEDSAALQKGNTLRLRKGETEQAEYHFDREGKLQKAIRIFEEGGELDADWEEFRTYDENGRITSIEGHYKEHSDGETFEPKSEKVAYDQKGRVIEETTIYHPVISGRDTLPNIVRNIYTYSKDGRSGTRERCRFLRQIVGEGDCQVDSLFFNENGQLIEVRWIDEYYHGRTGNHPPEMLCKVDDTGRLIRKQHYSWGTVQDDFHYFYDEKGHLSTVRRSMHRGYYLEHREYREDGLLRRVWREGEGIDFGEIDFVILYEFY